MALNRIIVAGVALLLILSVPHPALAQDSSPPEEGQQAGVTVHVVQRGETLFHIAQTYGTTVEAVQAANNILDPTRIEVGQRLIIPASASAPPDALPSITVQPSDSLPVLALRLGASEPLLAAYNGIVNPDLLFSGQRMVVASDPGGAQPIPSGQFHIVQPGETALSIAAAHNVIFPALLRANHLASPAAIYPGQRLVITGTGPALTGLESPWGAISIHPLPAEQGRSISLSVETSQPGSVTGRFLSRDVQFIADADHQVAIIGIGPFTRPGIYPLTLSFDGADGSMAEVSRGVYVADGEYLSETINVPGGLEGLLDEQLLDSEYALISSYMTGITPQKYWDGLFQLPTGGDVASAYGTRRDYQSGEAYLTDRFHSGADFAMPVGTPIRAPAPGVVVFAGPLEVRGNATIIDHGWGVYTGYWHQSGILVRAGEQVRTGQEIGNIGNTGLVTGAHLHWEMWVSGVQVDPMQWVRQVMP